MGLRALDEAAWLEVDEKHADETAIKRQLLSTNRDQVYVALPEALEASTELLDLIKSHHRQYFPNLLSETFAELPSLSPLETASLLTQEDLVIMTQRGSDWILSAACVCFPSRWDLPSLLGQNLHVIHEPVPHYEERIGAATDAMFHKFTADRPVWRINWTILDTDELHLPDSSGRRKSQKFGSLEEFGERVFFRTERQTLRVLPETKDVVFTIRNRVNSLNDVARQYAEFPNHLRDTLLTTSNATRDYKGWTSMWQDLMDWCDSAK